MTTTTQTAGLGFSGAQDARRGLGARLLAGVKMLRARARAMQELARMTDAELADIGLSRGDLPHLFDRRSEQG